MTDPQKLYRDEVDATADALGNALAEQHQPTMSASARREVAGRILERIRPRIYGNAMNEAGRRLARDLQDEAYEDLKAVLREAQRYDTDIPRRTPLVLQALCYAIQCQLPVEIFVDYGDPWATISFPQGAATWVLAEPMSTHEGREPEIVTRYDTVRAYFADREGQAVLAQPKILDGELVDQNKSGGHGAE